MAVITFVNPAYGPGHFSRASRSPAASKSGTVYYPLWLCYAAGYAEDRGHKAEIIDAAAKRAPYEQVVEMLKRLRDVSKTRTLTSGKFVVSYLRGWRGPCPDEGPARRRPVNLVRPKGAAISGYRRVCHQAF